MKSLKILLAVLVLTLGTTISANAQFRFGVRAGVTVSSMHFDKSTFDSDNQTGFTGGLTAQFTVPVIGIGADLSAMYVRRNASFMRENNITNDKRDYIEIPLNLRWNIGIPVVSKFLHPYITTGPSVAFLTSNRKQEGYTNKATDWAWNFGFGLQFINKIQIGASYGLGLTKAVNHFTDGQAANIDGKNRYWTITAAYLF
ncbi:MAG: porin family protein [Lachnoclostridium sp.]|nr:porin family protein [Lachnoclostridium sp.]